MLGDADKRNRYGRLPEARCWGNSDICSDQEREQIASYKPIR